MYSLKKLSDIINIQNGFAFKSSDYIEDGYFVMRIANVQDGYISMEDPKYIKEAHKSFEKFILSAGDILISLTGNVGRVGVIQDENLPAVLNQRVARISIKDTKIVSEKYLFYFLRSPEFFEELKGYGHGAAQQNISTKNIESIQIPLPPLSTQLNIVARLDSAMAEIDSLRAETESALTSTRQLWESTLESVFVSEGKYWEEKTLENVCEISSKLIDPKEEKYQSVLHVGGANIESITGKLLDLKTAKEEKLISGKFLFDPEMVLYSKIRPYLIKVVRPDFVGLCSADIYPLLPKKNILHKDFLYYLLISSQFTEYAIKGSARAGMPKVNREHLFAYRFSLPPLPEQSHIVAHLDAVRAETNRLGGLYRAKLASLDELRRSVLAEAFS